mmetsp:Transcript_5535/g.8825  ORF Transcript_5535/g.8825 Transcript_5535/m.8825 type:complete len:253 (-) Transcript_5535:1153-1911(-)
MLPVITIQFLASLLIAPRMIPPIVVQIKVIGQRSVVRGPRLLRVGLIGRHIAILVTVFLDVLPVPSVQELLILRRVILQVPEVIVVRTWESGVGQCGRDLVVLTLPDLIVTQNNLRFRLLPSLLSLSGGLLLLLRGTQGTTTARSIHGMSVDILLELTPPASVHHANVFLRERRKLAEVIDPISARSQQIVDIGVVSWHVVVKGTEDLVVPESNLLTIVILLFLVREPLMVSIHPELVVLQCEDAVVAASSN